MNNPDGTYQQSARPFPTPLREWLRALGLQPLGHLVPGPFADTYLPWKGNAERRVDWQSGCCVMFRADVLRKVNGFDERFFYQFEEVDLCHRVWERLLNPVYPGSVYHPSGRPVRRPISLRFAVEVGRNRYRYYYKHFGKSGARRCRRIIITHYSVRRVGYGLLNLVRPSEKMKGRLEVYRAVIEWNKRIDPVEFVKTGSEPKLEQITSLQTT